MVACSKSDKRDRYLGAWVPVDLKGSGKRSDTLRITKVEENIFVERGGITLAADYIEASNRLDFQIAAMTMQAKLSLTYIAKDDVLWLTGGVNRKTVFKRVDPK